jgi:hypothetical protein
LSAGLQFVALARTKPLTDPRAATYRGDEGEAAGEGQERTRASDVLLKSATATLPEPIIHYFNEEYSRRRHKPSHAAQKVNHGSPPNQEGDGAAGIA